MRSTGSTTSSSWCDAMAIDLMLREEWLRMRDRCKAKGLMMASDASLSLRIPGADALWFGTMLDVEPRRLPWKGRSASSHGLGAHVAVYAVRDDVGAVVIGGGTFGRRLADFGGAMPGV